MLKIKVEELGNVIIMHLTGKLFLESLNDLTYKWEVMVQKRPCVIAINCANLESIDSSSIGTLVKFFNEAMSKDIQLVFYDLNASIRKLFYTIHLQKFFSVISGEQFRKEYLEKICQAVN